MQLDAKTAGLMQYMKRNSTTVASRSTFDCLGLDSSALKAPGRDILAKRRLELMSKATPKSPKSPQDKLVASQVLFDSLALDGTSFQRAPVSKSLKLLSLDLKASSSLSTGSTSEGSDSS